MSDVMKTQHVLFIESPDALQTKVQVAMRLPFPLPWILIAGVLFVVGYAITFFSGDNLDAVRLLAIKSALIAAIANSVVFYEKLLDNVADTFPALLDEQDDKANQWISRWYESIFWSKKTVVMGLGLGSLCILSSAYAGSSLFESAAGRAYSFMITFIIGFLGGSMFWTMLGIARLTSSLGRDVRIKPSIFDSKTSLLRTASSVLWKSSLTSSLVYLLGVSMFHFCSIQPNELSLAIILIFGGFIILYFILPQMNIHKTLVRIKRTRLEALVQQIDHTFDNVAAQPTAENINQLRDLFHLQNIVNGKRSWSFGTGELLILIGTVLIPLLLFVTEYFVNR